MKANYDFSKGVKNPYASKVKEGYGVTVYHVFTQKEPEGEKASPTPQTKKKRVGG